MSFLSTDQRIRAVAQHFKYERLLELDEAALTERLAAVRELRRCNTLSIARILSADSGELPADDTLSIDTQTRETMRTGILHNPVVVTSGSTRKVFP